VTFGSDIDVLALTDGLDSRFDPDVYSVYSYRRIERLWREGSAFAWHLSLESKLLHAGDGTDFLAELGTPLPYARGHKDCQKFMNLLATAMASLNEGSIAPWFELSTAFLAARNFATCYSLAKSDTPDFSRNAAIRLGPDSVPISSDAYDVLQRSRLLSTRGLGVVPTEMELREGAFSLGDIKQWMERLLERIEG
jgi:hypothetical protein